MKDEDPKSKIKRLMQEGAQAPSNVIDFAAAAQLRGMVAPAKKVVNKRTQTINGNNNAAVMGDGNHVNLHVNLSHPSKAVQIKVQPGPQHIDSAQAAEVRELVSKVASVTPGGYSFVWSKVKRKFRFARYELITPDTYFEVCKYLRQWIASKQTTADQMQGDEQRKRLLMRIHAEARKTDGLLKNIHAYSSGRFGTEHLSELANGQLQELIKQFKL